MEAELKLIEEERFERVKNKFNNKELLHEPIFFWNIQFIDRVREYIAYSTELYYPIIFIKDMWNLLDPSVKRLTIEHAFYINKYHPVK
jgi:hypothetical protein